MDFRAVVDETADVTSLPRFFRGRLALLPAALFLTTGCDRLKGALNPSQVDYAWQNDSTVLAQKPTLLLRAVRTDGVTRAVPIATVGEKGVRALSMSTRGWRALDVQALQAGSTFVPYRGSDPLAPVPSARGMWEGTPLDSLKGCTQMLPAASVTLPDGVHLLTSGRTPLKSRPSGLSAGELQEVLNVVGSLVAPSAGIQPSKLSKYRREVVVVGTGATSSPTIVVSYEDPEPLPDSVTRIAERPRQLIVVLDKGVYGYKPSLTIADVTSSRIAPRRRFLGALDADGNGQSELFFGLGTQVERAELVTYSYRFVGDTWIADFSYERTRCIG
jgi:hypothetical protein